MKTLHEHCAALDVHKDTVVACIRRQHGNKIEHDVRTFSTTTSQLIALWEWLEQRQCTHVAMEATGVYWKPVWHVSADGFALVLANAAHIRNVPRRKSDVNDATWIADLLAHGLIRSTVPSGGARRFAPTACEPKPRKCAWPSTNPGASVRPSRSTAVVVAPMWAFSMSALMPTARIFPSFTASASAPGCASFTVTMGPPT
jgi:hypothetical protein